jgi:hypothetical protein
MAMLVRYILHDYSSGLNVWRLKVSEKAMFVTGRRRDAVVANEGLCEDKDLAAVRGIGHRLWVANERGREDCFTRDVGLRAEGLAMENWSILERAVSHKQR